MDDVLERAEALMLDIERTEPAAQVMLMRMDDLRALVAEVRELRERLEWAMSEDIDAALSSRGEDA